jgi:hypothetical protein
MRTKQREAEAQAPAGASADELPFAIAIGRPFQKQFGVCRTGQYSLIGRGDVETFVVGDGRGRRFIVT